MAEQQPEVWGQLDAESIDRQRRGQIRKKSRRGDAIYFLLLIPSGLALIVGGTVWMGIGEGYWLVRLSAAAVILLGAYAWVIAGKILIGR